MIAIFSIAGLVNASGEVNAIWDQMRLGIANRPITTLDLERMSSDALALTIVVAGAVPAAAIDIRTGAYPMP